MDQIKNRFEENQVMDFIGFYYSPWQVRVDELGHIAQLGRGRAMSQSSVLFEGVIGFVDETREDHLAGFAPAKGHHKVLVTVALEDRRRLVGLAGRRGEGPKEGQPAGERHHAGKLLGELEGRVECQGAALRESAEHNPLAGHSHLFLVGNELVNPLAGGVYA